MKMSMYARACLEGLFQHVEQVIVVLREKHEEEKALWLYGFADYIRKKLDEDAEEENESE